MYGYGYNNGFGYGYGFGYGRPNSICQMLGIVQGDRIIVRSAGHIVGTGTFIRTQGHHIVWIDQLSNMRVTDLSTIDVSKVSCCVAETNSAPVFVD